MRFLRQVGGVDLVISFYWGTGVFGAYCSQVGVLIIIIIIIYDFIGDWFASRTI